MHVILLVCVLAGCIENLILAALFCLARRPRRQDDQVLSRRLETEGQIEAATMFTMAAMREAARQSLRGSAR